MKISQIINDLSNLKKQKGDIEHWEINGFKTLSAAGIEDKNEFTYCRIVQYVALLHGFDINLEEALELWEHHSDDNAYSFMPGNMTDFESVWDCIKSYILKDYEDEDLEECIPELLDSEWLTDIELKINHVW
jgi:hypothetical protein